MTDIDIKGIDKAELLAALYNGARPQGMGFLQARPGDMTVDEARTLLDRVLRNGEGWFDYVLGRPIKVGFKGDMLLRADLYDRDAPGGAGSVQSIVDELRK